MHRSSMSFQTQVAILAALLLLAQFLSGAPDPPDDTRPAPAVRAAERRH